MEQIALPISPDVLHNELETARAIMDKWTTLIGEKGIPGVDTPAPLQDTERFLREMIGELQVVSGKCDTLAEVVGAAIV